MPRPCNDGGTDVWLIRSTSSSRSYAANDVCPSIVASKRDFAALWRISIGGFGSFIAAPGARVSVDPVERVRIERERARFEAFHDALDARRIPGGAPRDEQREEVLLRRVRARGLGRAIAVVDERLRVVRLEPCAEPVGE